MEYHERTLELEGETISLSYAEAFSQAGDHVYWASLWPSSVALAQHLLRGASLKEKMVLELGSGCGLAGIAAGKRRGEVTVTDLMPEALQLSQENWNRNGISPNRLQQMDWCQPSFSETFDLILGADILYHPNQYPDLLRTVGQLLSVNGSILIADPGRPHANEFFARTIRAGYRLNTTHYAIVLHGREFPITVTEMT